MTRDEKIAAAQALCAEGVPRKVAADELGVARSTITLWLGPAFKLGRDPRERFLDGFTESPNGCWVWTRSLTASGYGRFALRGGYGYVLAHRYAYELFVDVIPDGLQIDHLCRNRACCNPAHLEAVTPRENQRRGEGLAGQRARQTHCQRGHTFDEANTAIDSQGRRRCRACTRWRGRRYRAKEKVAA